MKNILVIGSINMDLVIGTPRMPKLGETLHGSGFATHAGGKGANQAVAAARLGCNVAMLGAVGSDAYGEILKNHLQANGVDTAGVAVKDTNSGIAVITVCGGDNCIILEQGANFRVDEALITEHKDLISWADIVVLQFEIPMNTVVFAAKMAKEMGKTVIVNPAPWQKLPPELFSYTDILIPNQHEAAGILDTEVENPRQAEAALYKLKELGVKTPVITLGETGVAALNERGEFLFLPAQKAVAVDTTGAGDSFIGGLCRALAEDTSLEEGLKLGTAVAAITVTRNGASEAFPTLRELNYA